MFSDIGRKIKTVSQTFCCLGIALSVLLGLILFAVKMVLPGFLVALLGSILSWLSSLISYGFGQLIENSDAQRKMLEKQADLLSSMQHTSSARSSKQENSLNLQKLPAKATVHTEFEIIPPSNTHPKEAVIFPHRIDGFIACPRCGERQRGNRNLCQSCKTPFKYESENVDND